MRTNFPIATAFFAAALLSGCATVDRLINGEDLPSLEGEPITSIHAAHDLLFHNGILIVANRGDSAGVAGFDTNLESIRWYRPYRVAPSSIAIDPAGRLAVFRSENRRVAISVLEPLYGAPIHSDPSYAGGPGAVFAIGTGVQKSLLDHQGVYRLHRLQINDISLSASVSSNVSFANPILAVTSASGGLFVAESQRNVLWRFEGDFAHGIKESIDVSPPGDTLDPHQTRITSLASHDGHVFAAVNRGPAATDSSSYVAVIKAATGALVKTIPLNFRNPVSGSVRDDRWYLTAPGISWESSGNHVADGGVEAIDLTTQQHSGIIATEAALEGEVGRFVAAAPGTGYAIIRKGDGGSMRVIRKVSF